MEEVMAGTMNALIIGSTIKLYNFSTLNLIGSAINHRLYSLDSLRIIKCFLSRALSQCIDYVNTMLPCSNAELIMNIVCIFGDI